MTDNFLEAYKYLNVLGMPKSNKDGMFDMFVDIQLIRRGKDHKDLPSANYNFKVYYIDSLDKFDNYKDEIKDCCDLFKLRAYMSVSPKSKESLLKTSIFQYSQALVNNDFKRPWKIFISSCGKVKPLEKRWVVDVDCEISQDKVLEIICRCDSSVKNPYIRTFKTKNGYHLITLPFNLKQFQDYWKIEYPDIEIPEIKKNHLTLLYENI